MAILIFISGRDLAISSAEKGKSGFIHILAKLFEPRKRACINMLTYQFGEQLCLIVVKID